MSGPATREAAFSLLDCMIAAALVAVVIGLAYPTFHTARDTMATSGRRDRLERSADRALRGIVEAVRSGRVVRDLTPDSPPTLSIHRPAADTPLEDLGAEGGVPWSGVPRTLRFRAIEEFVEEEERADLNRDGDRDDRFALGVLELTDGDSVRRLTGNARVVLGLPSYEGDLDGDGIEDPLFAVEGRAMRVRLVLVQRDGKNRLQTTSVEQSIRLRNSQE